jgi:hypothetical protein
MTNAWDVPVATGTDYAAPSRLDAYRDAEAKYVQSLLTSPETNGTWIPETQGFGESQTGYQPGYWQAAEGYAPNPYDQYMSWLTANTGGGGADFMPAATPLPEGAKDPYLAYREFLSPEQRAEYDQVLTAHQAKTGSTMQGAAAAAFAAIGGLGALANPAAFSAFASSLGAGAGTGAATGAVGSVGGELTAGLTASQIAALGEGIAGSSTGAMGLGGAFSGIAPELFTGAGVVGSGASALPEANMADWYLNAAGEPLSSAEYAALSAEAASPLSQVAEQLPKVEVNGTPDYSNPTDWRLEQGLQTTPMDPLAPPPVDPYANWEGGPQGPMTETTVPPPATDPYANWEGGPQGPMTETQVVPPPVDPSTGLPWKSIVDTGLKVLPLLPTVLAPLLNNGSDTPAATTTPQSTSSPLEMGAARSFAPVYHPGPGSGSWEGHTRGPSSAVNPNDPSAALFGYGQLPDYFQQPGQTVLPGVPALPSGAPPRQITGMAEGGAVSSTYRSPSDPYSSYAGWTPSQGWTSAQQNAWQQDPRATAQYAPGSIEAQMQAQDLGNWNSSKVSQLAMGPQLLSYLNQQQSAQQAGQLRNQQMMQQSAARHDARIAASRTQAPPRLGGLAQQIPRPNVASDVAYMGGSPGFNEAAPHPAMGPAPTMGGGRAYANPPMIGNSARPPGMAEGGGVDYASMIPMPQFGDPLYMPDGPTTDVDAPEGYPVQTDLHRPPYDDRQLPTKDEGPMGWITRLMDGDKKTVNQAILALGGVGALASLLGKRGVNPGFQSVAQLKASLPTNANMSTQQLAKMASYFSAPPHSYVPAPGLPGIVKTGGKGLGYAEGGLLNDGVMRARAPADLSQLVSRPVMRAQVPGRPEDYLRTLPFDSRAQAHVSHGDGGGQDDRVPANLSPGEYVMDADVVSALGDGSNAAGAKALDAMRQRVREHKRGAPADSIPPRAKSPLEYFRGGR